MGRVTKVILTISLVLTAFPAVLFSNYSLQPIEADITTDLEGYWKLNEASWSDVAGEVVDSSGNGLHGRGRNGATTTSGIINRAGTFDGGNDYVDIGDQSSLDFGTGDFSVAAWVKTTSSSFSTILSKGNHTSNVGFSMDMYSTGGFRCILIDNTSQMVNTAINGYNDGKWHHVSCTRSNGNLKIYVDGDHVATDTGATASVSSTAGFNIGIRSGSSPSYLNGTIDEVRAYSRQLTSYDVYELYEMGLDIHSDLEGHWKMDEASWDGTADEVVDSSGNANHGDIYGTPDTVLGKVQRAGTFNGTTEAVDLPENSSLSVGSGDSFTVSAWAKIAATENGRVFIFSQQRCLQGAIQIGIENTGYPRFRINDTSANNVYLDHDVAYNDGKWHHWAAVRDVANDSVHLYLDGVEAEFAQDVTTSAITSSPTQNWIGRRYLCGGTNEFDGEIDDVRFYSRGLNADEIALLYSEAFDPDSDPALEAHWKMDESSWNGTANEVVDSSGNSNHGQSYNGATTTSQGLSDYAGSFDGSNDRVEVADNDLFDASLRSFSYSVWVKVPADISGGSGTIRAVVSKMVGGTGEPRMDISIRKSTGTAYVQIESSTNGDISSITGSTDLRDNEWHHIVFQRNRPADKLELYVDGEQDAIPVTDGDQNGANSGKLYIGDWGADLANGRVHSGQIDELRIYSRALKTSEIRQVYNEGEIELNATCPNSVQARFTAGDLGLVQSGTYSQSTVNGDMYGFSWSAVMNGDAINIENVFGGEVTLTMPDSSTVVRDFARGEGIGPIPPATGTYQIHARATNGELCDSASITVVADTANGIVDPPDDTGVTDESSGEDRTTIPGSGTEWVYVRNGGNDIVAKIQVDMSTGIDWNAMFADHKTPAQTGGAGVAVLHYPGGVTNIPGVVGTWYYLYVPRDASDTAVRICPDAETVDDLSARCAGGITLNEGTTGQYTVTKVNLEGDNLWEIAGVTGTGGLGTQEGNSLYIDLDAQPGVIPSNISTAPEVAISTADEFYASYIPSSTEFASVDYIDIVIPQTWSGLATCASSTTDADGDSTADGSMAVQSSQIIRYTFSAATTTALTTGVEVCFAATSPGSPGNHSIASSDTNDGDYSAALIYVGDDNDVTVTGTVPASLSLRIKEPTTTSDTNACSLGILNPGSVNSCSYRIAVGTNGSAGLEIFVLADATLDNSGATADIDDTGAGTDIVAGTEGHGVRVTLGSGFTTTASFSESNDNPMPQTETQIFDAASAITDSNENTWSTVTHSASVDASTAADSYTQIVTYRVWADS